MSDEEQEMRDKRMVLILAAIITIVVMTSEIWLP